MLGVEDLPAEESVSSIASRANPHSGASGFSLLVLDSVVQAEWYAACMGTIESVAFGGMAKKRECAKKVHSVNDDNQSPFTCAPRGNGFPGSPQKASQVSSVHVTHEAAPMWRITAKFVDVLAPKGADGKPPVIQATVWSDAGDMVLGPIDEFIAMERDEERKDKFEAFVTGRPAALAGARLTFFVTVDRGGKVNLRKEKVR